MGKNRDIWAYTRPKSDTRNQYDWDRYGLCISSIWQINGRKFTRKTLFSTKTNRFLTSYYEFNLWNSGLT